VSHQDRPFGLWPSPLSPSQMAAQRRLFDLCWDDASSSLVWLESRSGHGMLLLDEGRGDTPRELNVDRSARAQVGYGGGDMTASQGHVYYASQSRLYRQALAQGIETPATPSFGDAAAPTVSPDGRWVLYVHSYEGEDRLALVDAQGERWPIRLAEGHDFYMQPVWHPIGRRIAWVAWDHPQMPWDGTLLYLADLGSANGGAPRIDRATVIAGDADTSVFQPAFAPHGRSLAYVSDAGGWYNLYLYALDSGTHRPLAEVEAELGRAAWVQGMRTFAWAPDGEHIYYVQSSRGYDALYRVEIESGTTQEVAGLEEYTHLSQPAMSRDGVLACIAASPLTPPRIIALDPGSGSVRVVARSSSESIPTERLVAPEPLTWRTEAGDKVHGLFYEPEAAEREERPPLVLLVHGGPTSQATATYSAQAQFLATRGYAVLDLNYRGSSGYGRAYRDALRERWGIVDVEDAVGGASYLADAGRVDRDRMVIMGGSAGGYTVLQALVRHPGFFRAGVCLYGVTNLFTLAADTHKFEARYLDSLIGPLPEQAARYRERSPLFYADQIRDPIIVFQGEEDRVVPKAQADEIVQALRRNGVPHEYHLYPGEGHGWRKAETIERFYTALETFLRQYVIFS
jgi:dipeptidyl aminopeptidase/acylaminoacyl peptidase